MEQMTSLRSRRMPVWAVAVVFSGLWVVALGGMAARALTYLTEENILQQVLYTLLSSLLLAVVGTYAAAAWYGEGVPKNPAATDSCAIVGGVFPPFAVY